jgi:hypothetical protein
MYKGTHLGSNVAPEMPLSGATTVRQLDSFFRTAFAGHSPIGRQFSSMIRVPMIDAGL